MEKKLTKKEDECYCPPKKGSWYAVFFAVVIIVLVWVAQGTWAKVGITIAAAIILLANLLRKSYMKN